MNKTYDQEDLKELEKKLRELNSLKQLRDLLGDLNYQVTNKSVSTSEWGQLSQTARDGELKIIARHERFIITHCRLPELKRTVERALVTRLIKQYERGLFIFSDHNFKKWHFVNVKEDTRNSNRLVLRRITVGPEEKLRTATERLALLNVTLNSWSELQVEERHEEAFDVEKVTKQFYDEYKGKVDNIKNRLLEKNGVQPSTAQAFAQQFLNRMMFLYFLQRKGWLDGNKDFVHWLWKTYQKDPTKSGDFYTRYLDALFFQALNSPPPKPDLHNRRDLPDEVKQVFLKLPYLNGGLFSRLEGIDDQGLVIKDDEFREILEGLLEHYNFTITEDTPFDKEVAVNPEMLGKVYESLVFKEEQGQAGIFYTPRVEVDFMCRRSLIEYLDEEPIIDRTDLIKVVMNAENSDPDDFESIPDLPAERWIKIRQRLEEVTVVDPACGSGAFLVGMMQVLCGLHRLICKRLGEEYHDFQVKKRIIGKNLFGVDIKEWAVRVAELRLWLSLIIDASREEVQKDPKEPILPNLTFRIQVGDSLVAEIAGHIIPPLKHYIKDREELNQKINSLAELKKEYFSNPAGVIPSNDIRSSEMEVLKKILDIAKEEIEREVEVKIKERNGYRKILITTQHNLGVYNASREKEEISHIDTWKKEIKKIDREIEILNNKLRDISEIKDSQDVKPGKRPFIWEIEFIEIFKFRGGFDIVIGNPPYVRHEDITPLNKNPQNYTLQQWQEEKDQYKEYLLRSVETHWGKEVKVGRQADLYVYFYIVSLSLLRRGGTFCFITSNSWLDVGYGADLQRFLLTNMEIKDIYDNHAKRSFASSDINTVIVLFRRPQGNGDLSRHIARFVAFKRPYEEVLSAENLNNIERANQILRTDDLWVYPITQGDLWQAGLKSDEEGTRTFKLGFGFGDYKGDKWGGKYLRAPDIFFTILEKGKGKLVKLGEICKIRWGIKTGANEFFFLEPTGQPARPGSVSVKNEAGWEGLIEAEFLKPVVKSPREIKTILIRPKDLKYRLFMCRLSKEELKRQGKSCALDYIAWGENQGYNKRHTCASRPRWWDLGEREPANIICNLSMGNNMRFYYINNEIYCSNNFHSIYSGDHIIAALCSFIFTRLMCGLEGRVSFGGGLLGLLTYEVRDLLILHPKVLSSSHYERLVGLFDKIANQKIKSIFEELGLPEPVRDYSKIRPEDVTLDKVLPEQRELDKVVFEALGLTEEEQLEVYRAVVTLVKERLSRASSVKSNDS